jgi:LDH2 family malate/lactate/ureidoglycolate dehydrogenase
MGMVVAEWAMNYAIEKAKQFGIGIVAVVNSNHYGIAGYYVEQACTKWYDRNHGNQHTSVKLLQHTELKICWGTNPLAWGFPSDEDHPYVLDFATSVVPRGKIEMYERHGWPLPTRDGSIGGDGKALPILRQR